MKDWLPIVNAVLIILVIVTQITFAKQLGFLLRFISPGGARDIGIGPRQGEDIASFLSEIESYKGSEKFSILVFGSDSCSVCKIVFDAMLSLSKDWRDEVGFLYFCENADSNTLRLSNKDVKVFTDTGNLRTKLGITTLPFAVIMNENSVVLGRGVVNNLGHIESLLSLTETQPLSTSNYE